MPAFLSRYQQDATASHLIIPSILLLSSIGAYIGTASRHSLLTSAIAWTSICAYTSARVGIRSLLDAASPQKLAWSAGALLALTAIEERSVGGAGRGIWWAKGLLPLIVYAISKSDLLATTEHTTVDVDSPTTLAKSTTKNHNGNTATLIVLSACAVAAIFSTTGSNATLGLGLSCAAATAMAILLVERARTEALHQSRNGGSVIYSANGLLSHPEQSTPPAQDSTVSLARDISAAAAVGTFIASIMQESFSFHELSIRSLPGDGFHLDLERMMLKSAQGLAMVLVHTAMNGSLLIMIHRHDAFITSFVPLYAVLCARLIVGFSSGRLWFAALCSVATLFFLDEQGTFTAATRMRLRSTKLLTVVAIASFAVLAFVHLRHPFRTQAAPPPPPLDIAVVAPPAAPLSPLQYTNSRVHPVDQLVRDAETSWLVTQQKQSQSLEDAVDEYKRRYRLAPPPNFDEWYEFAKQRNVQLIDEYDSIYHSLLPFWAVPPATLRARVREALGFGNNQLMGLLVRGGKVVHTEGGPDWMREAIPGMMEHFAEFLPDIDLPFNLHDEPRVVVPHDELDRLVKIAINQRIPAAVANAELINAFSPRPSDVRNSKRIAEYKTTRFNVFAHQPVWLPSRLSCSPDSQARCLDDGECGDNNTAYALGDLGFIYNHTAFSDICNSPSLAVTHGFFDRPNAFNVIHDLFPIFSQSKMSSFQDILYPSPWYWYGKVAYESKYDRNWKTKTNSLWWRGSTTGGFSRDGGWRRQHRQQVVTKLNALDDAKVLTNVHRGELEASPEWQTKEVSREDNKEVIDVHFSHIGQCDPGDCDAQREFFKVAPQVNQQDAWNYRFLLDMDGNAFSGRFYAFLQSKSLTFKMAVFREWHEEWIKPWVHYVPMSLRGEEALETVRYLSAEEEGKQQAVRMAEESREWAGKVLRKEDFEVWFFRLLLEYARIVDDNRETIGFSGV